MAYRSMIDDQSGKVFIDRALEANGPMANAQDLPIEVINAHTLRLPAILLDVWENHGVGDLCDGKLRLCVPGILKPAVDLLFRDDPYFAGDSHAIAYGAFGDLLIWSQRHQLVYVNMQLSSVDAPVLFQPALAGSPDRVILDQVLMRHPGAMDAYDADGNPMYEAARDTYGPLEEGQIYGMLPPAPFHEAYTLDAHRRVDVVEWLTDKIVNSRFSLDDALGRRLAVRKIGPLTEGETLRRPGEL